MGLPRPRTSFWCLTQVLFRCSPFVCACGQARDQDDPPCELCATCCVLRDKGSFSLIRVLRWA